MTDTHADEKIDPKRELRGNSHKGGDAPPEVQQKIIDIIIEEARKLQFDNRDIAYYIAIAKRESGFNPDAANSNSTASGVSQLIDKTAKTYGVNDDNRFDARANIKAGLQYFLKLKRKVDSNFGSATGKHEILIYYCYHYGEFSVNRRETVNGQVVVKEALPFSQLEGNAKYVDSKTVVDEAERIEKILNDTHGLKIKLIDVLGKNMAGRKVIVVQKKEKQPPLESSNLAPEKMSASAPVVTPSKVSGAAPESGNGTSVATPEREPTIQSVEPCSINQVHVTWELLAYEVTTDEEGNIPEINSESQEPFVILIPRFEYESYNEAVSKNEIPEDGNQHELSCRNEAASMLPAIKSPEEKIEKKSDSKPTTLSTVEIPRAKAVTVNIFSEAEKGSKQGPVPTPSADPAISFNDIVIAVKKDLGWTHVYSTSFAYAKQFFTRPKLPDKPLDENTPTRKSLARTQSIGSSLKNQDSKLLKVKDKVTTAEQPVITPVEVVGDAPWMAYALIEQSKSGLDKVTETAGSHRSDAKWKDQHVVRTDAEKSIKSSQTNLAKEKHKSDKNQDAQKITELELKIKEQQTVRDDADEKMQEIEHVYNNSDIVKYLQSTTLTRDLSRDDETAWCSSFANWCVEKSGYHGTGNALAESWMKWGEKIEEPRYGAITVTTRASNPVKYHVGFYLGIGKKTVNDGEEEIEVKGRGGVLIKQKRKKTRKVDTVRLLSGNYSRQVKEGDEWTILAADNTVKHLVSYHWPTVKEKK
ncbi:MAG: TIGR02594 family protein [Undibacterium sp.]|uniref:TIGR02594 family protein n=1 Tax=Undibacterium sp. TaxID=1914977 RepID=UPI00271E5A02|nr:TIGR02594 family protein [Undibacterium sp.]MDO8653129.1 TIGR02594 family protein [Undibacterium sp.]